MHRRQFGKTLAALLATSPGLTFATEADTLHEGPLRLVVGFPAGGATDVVARILAEGLMRHMPKQVVVVENRGGAGGQIAAQQLKKTPANGATIMLSIDHTQVIIPLTVPAAGYDGVADFTPLAGVAVFRNVLSVNASMPVASVQDLQTWLKAQPGAINYGIPAPNSVPQLIGQILGRHVGVSMNPVPYRGGAPMVQDLLAGHVPMGVGNMADALEHHRAGRLRILAMDGQTRSQHAADIPTFEELGIAGVAQTSWQAMFAPPGLPAALAARFEAAFQAVLEDAQVRERLGALSLEPTFAPAAQVRQWVTEGTRHWGALLRETGFKPQG